MKREQKREQYDLLYMQGWEWVDEGKTGGPLKLGWRTMEPQRSITLNVSPPCHFSILA